LVEVIARLRISDELYTRTYNEKIFSRNERGFNYLIYLIYIYRIYITH